jgi:aminoglycoside 3-N-acetyltransferase
MPALSYASVRSNHPVFDVIHTPSCVGGLPEYFRTRAGTLRSLHPTHSVCGVGAQAAQLLAGHEQDHSPVGANSAFARLPRVAGQILFLGCGLRPNTSMHGIEERIEPPYLYAPAIDYTLVRADGSQLSMHARRHNFQGWVQRYDRLEAVMPAGIAHGRVLQAECFLVESALMWPAAEAALRQDPLFFVEPGI